MTEDRPRSLPNRPRPAPDRNIDPVDSVDSERPLSPTPAPLSARKKRERTVVLNTRVTEEIRDMIDDAAARTGKTIREVVEAALKEFCS